jgi:hypothetical protein
MTTYTLVAPFLTDDPLFAYGVEYGLLFARMREEGSTEIGDFFCRQNQERILLLANRLGWHVAEMKPTSKDWFWCRLMKE